MIFVDIDFRTKKMANIFNSEKALYKEYGSRMARVIMMRLAVLKNARVLALVPTSPPDRLHQLTGNRKGRFAVDLVQPYRLILAPSNEPIPLKEDGGIDRDRVTAITVLDVVDYH